MRGRTKIALAVSALVALVLVVAAVWFVGWGSTPARVQDGPPPTTTLDVPSPSGPVVSASVGPNSALPPEKAGSSGCARMDGVLSRLLSQTPQGREFSAEVARERRLARTERSQSGAARGRTRPREANSQRQWIAFLGILVAHEGDFRQAAGSDPSASDALREMKTVWSVQPKLLSGAIPKYTDAEDAYEQMQAGRTPPVNPAYTRANEQLDPALDRVSWCMPSWPVLF